MRDEKTKSAKAGHCVAAGIALIFMALLVAWLLPLREAQAADAVLTRHAMPVTEPSLQTDSSKLTGENWMSGVPGSLFLHEINIPGMHDSCMYDPYAVHNFAKRSINTHVRKTMKWISTVS